MIFPIGDDNVVGGKPPIIVFSILGLNLAVFIFQLSMSPFQIEWFINEYGMLPSEISRGENLSTLISSLFLHGGWFHFLGNMIFLWIFSDNIEAVTGSIVFLIFYLLGGIVASLSHLAFNPMSDIPSVGASGAISAVMGTYLVMFPKSRIRIFIFFFFITVQLSAFTFLAIWFFQQLLSGMGSIGIESTQTSGVAWWAHIGGFIYGLLAGVIFKFKYGHLYRYG